MGLYPVPLSPQEEADLVECLTTVGLEMKRDERPDVSKVSEERALRQFARQQAILEPILAANGFVVGALQVYLDEFVFRFNRRRTPMAAFQTLLGIGASLPPTTYEEIKEGAFVAAELTE